MSELKTYLQAVRDVRRTGAATPETPYYPALSQLFNAFGRELSPKVACVFNLQNTGGGLPDGGFFTPDQYQRGSQAPAQGTLPSRGVIEVKPASQDMDELTASEQVQRYLERYGQVFTTNLRSFRLLVRLNDGTVKTLEPYDLAEDEAAFWSQSVNSTAAAHDGTFPDFLKRVMLHLAPLKEPKDVAWFLASYAREAKLRVEQHPLSAFRSIKAALEEGLGIRFEGERGEHFFRSTLVQTMFYGIFSAWVLWSRRDGKRPGATFDWRLSADYLQVPVLRKLFHEMTDRGSLNAVQLVEVLEHAQDTLNRVDRDAFFSVFADHEAVAYFYEPFLEAFDPELRKDLGVWYTPIEIVRYMVERVDQVLRTELDRPRGLADAEVYVLDPCCGTGGYLVAVLERIAKTLAEEHGEDALSSDDLKEAALKRVFGFEILPAPFVVAHLQLNSLLEHHNAALSAAMSERVPVFLTNALTGWEPLTEPKHLPFAELEEERDSADEIKQQTKILVILGNPPYNGFAGIAKMDEERDLTNAYRTAVNVAQPQGHGLNELYVRFFRMAERRIVEKTGQGVVCFISNYSWLDGLSHTAMRERYLGVFDQIWIDNLHGDRKISEYAPDGRTSQTVFAMRGQSAGIKVGTAIGMFVRRPVHRANQDVRYRDFEESRASARRNALLASLNEDESGYEIIRPNPQMGLPMKPRAAVGSRYLTWPKLPELFAISFPGVKTSRDPLVIDIDRDRLEERMKRYFDKEVSDEAMRAEVPSSMERGQRFDAVAVRKQLQEKGFRPWHVLRHSYRPFDMRWMYWEPDTKLLDEKRADFVEQFNPGTYLLTATQQNRRTFDSINCCSQIIDVNLADGSARCFPLDIVGPPLIGHPEVRSNLSTFARDYLAGIGGADRTFFQHILAVTHSPRYGDENAGALLRDMPRIPLPQGVNVLEHSGRLGLRLASCSIQKLNSALDLSGIALGR